MTSVFYPRCHALLSVVFDGRSPTQPNTEPLLLEATPISANVTRNGYHEPDTWSLEFDARSLPFDPEIVASIAVVIYMFNASGLDDRREWAVPAYEMVRGLADEPELTIGDGQRVSMSGRDYTALLADTEWDPRNRIPSGRPLDQMVQDLADAAAPPGTRARFEVVYDSQELRSPPIVGASRRSTKKKGLWVKPGKSYWEVIYEMALNEGLIAFVRGEQIILTDPQTQTRQSVATAPRVVHGRTLSSLRVRRKLAKERIPQLKITAYDPRARSRIEVVYPKAKQEITTGLGLKKNEVMVLPAPRGVRDRDALLRYAQARFENMARAEATYEVATRHLEDVAGYDLLQLREGTPLWVEFDPFNAEQLRALDEAQRYEHIVALGYREELAAFVAQHYQRLEQFRQPFYTRQVSFDYSADGGIDISAEVVNYAYEAREERAKNLEAA